MRNQGPFDRPRHGFVDRNYQQYNGFFTNNECYYAVSGSIADIVGGATGSIQLRFDAYGLKLKRFEIFHSGSASGFDVSLDTVQTGSDYDPRNVMVDYIGIAGSADYTGGMDQVEDLVGITGQSGSLYLKVKPYDTGLNTFKYFAFFEAILVYV